MTYTQRQAEARAKAKVGDSNRVGYCLAECVAVYGIPGPYGWGGNGRAWAYNYWLNAVAHGKVVKTSDPEQIPAGALLFHAPRPGATTIGGKAGHVAIGAGNGYEYSTDQPREGRWGRVKISAVEQSWGKKLLGYIVVTGDGVRLMPDPTPTIKLDPWFTGLGWNLSASDFVHGQASWNRRVPDLIDAIKHFDRDVLHLVEAETQGQQGDTFAKALKAAGYVPVIGDNQRLLAVRKGIKVGRTKVVTLGERGPANDDKQIVLAEVWPDGPNAVVLEAGHLDYRNGDAYDKVRVTQGKQTKAAALAFAKACGVEHSRVVFYNDENSESLVSTEAFGKTWPDLGDRESYSKADVSTLIPWSGKVAEDGYRPDKVHVHKERPARGGTSTTFADEGIADHLPVIYTAGKK